MEIKKKMKIEKIGLKEKDDSKSRVDLIPAEVILALGDALNYGAKKYKPNSWQNVKDGDDIHYASALRHLLKWRNGIKIDSESNQSHILHAFSNIMFILYREINNVGNKKYK